MNTMLKLGLVAMAGITMAGCATPQYQARESEYNSSIGGALIGGTLGGVLGNNLGDGKNDLLGAAIGAATGAWIGQQYGQGNDQVRHRLNALESQNAAETIMVNNSNGSYTPVTLTKVGYGQYRGPRGEIYTARPSEDQLKTAYGF